jgi:hypothetical protein
MPISVMCLKCGSWLKAPEKAAGHSSKCPECGATVLVPGPTPAATPPAQDAVLLADVPIIWVDKPNPNSLNRPMSTEEVERALAVLQAVGIAATHQRREDPCYDWGGAVEHSEEWDIFIVARDNEKKAREIILKAIGRGAIQRGDGT